MPHESTGQRTQSKLIPIAAAAALYGLYALSRPRFSFRNKSVLITGGSRGLGLSIAWNVLERGGRVTLLARDQEELKKGRKILLRTYPNAEIGILVCDITRSEELRAALDQTISEMGGVDVLVNNAGAIEVGPFATMEMEDFDAQMRLHFYAVVEAIQMIKPHFLSRNGGRILNICSLGGKAGVPHMAAYNASKFALAGFVQSVHGELAKQGIFMTTVYPTLMRTGSPIQAVFKGNAKAEFRAFETIDNMPVLSMSADRAAKKMLDAVERGRSETILSLSGKMRVVLGALAPQAMDAIMDLTARWLPEGRSKRARTGAQSTPRKERTKHEIMYNQEPRHNAEFNIGLRQ